ncbi:MAG: cyclic nucleotide-binding domain-containing protein [Muribaculaceae bacterium]|nr:cyclic nucleotide-binding domain-containing protein [Muribaculaceae bacterium]
MNTKTMYETLMDLPLFKGVSADHISSFLEKTSIEFHRFTQGDIIVTQGEPVRSLKFLLSGEINLCTRVLNGKVQISSKFDGHEAIGATRLFGMHPLYEFTIEAAENVSIMEFSKEKYISLLQSDPIYMLNFANLLSMNVHKASETFPHFTRMDLSRVLAEWLVLFTGRKSREIRIGKLSTLAEVYGEGMVRNNIDQLLSLSLISVVEDEVFISDREALIEYAMS